jgi:purine catabolism regulator
MADITILDLLSWESRLTLPQGGELDGSGASSERALDSEISWAVTLRASMPILPPLRGGEIVILPDRILPDTGVPVDEIVREVANRGARGLVVERFIAAPSSLITLYADSIPADLESDINRVLTEQRGEIYRAGTELGRLLTQANALGADVEDVLKTASDYLGMGAAVISVRDGVIASAGPVGDAAPGDLSADSDRRGWHGDRYLRRISQGAELWLGPVAPSRRALARLISERVGMAVDDALAHAIDVRPRGNARANAISGLLTDSGSDSGKIGVALGLPTNGSYAVVLSSAGANRSAIAREIASLGTPHEASEIDGMMATLVELNTRSPRFTGGEHPASGRQQAPGQENADHWIVLSEPVTGVARIPLAARQARYLAALVTGGLLHGSHIRFDRPADVGVYRLMFPLWGSPELETFSRDTLGQLLTRDRRGSLRRTLLAYLEAGGSQVDAATRLDVHRNTLSYRLRQIAELTGTDPTKPQSHLALHMALLASVLPPAPIVQTGT